MTRYLGPKDSNKNGEQSFIQFVSSLFSGQVATGLTVTQQSTPTIGVSVAPGTAAIPTGNGYPYTIWSTATENVTLNTADGSNPRIDLIIAYVDLSIANTSSSNSPGGWSLLKVTGTPSGSPVVPNSSAIQAALPNSSYPYIILAQVAVAAGATTITNANITDVRTWAQLGTTNINFGGAWQSCTSTLTNWGVGTGGSAGTIANYTQLGKTVHFRIRSILGTSGFSIGTGAIAFTLPVPANAELAASASEGYIIGQAKLLDATIQAYEGRVQVLAGDPTQAFLIAQSASGTYLTQAAANNAIPFAWGAGDMFMATCCYEAA